MKDITALLLKLSMLRGKRYTRELQIKNKIYFTENYSMLEPILADNWETDKEISERIKSYV